MNIHEILNGAVIGKGSVGEKTGTCLPGCTEITHDFGCPMIGKIQNDKIINEFVLEIRASEKGLSVWLKYQDKEWEEFDEESISALMVLGDGKCGHVLNLVPPLSDLLARTIQEATVQRERETITTMCKRLVGRKCSCGKPATIQLAKGVYNIEIGGLPQNDELWCSKCFDEGLRIENEAMYG